MLLLAVTVDPSVFAAIVLASLGTGGLGAVVAYRKAGPENTDLAARTMAFVNEELRTELKRRDEEIANLRERVAYLESRDRIGRGVDPIQPSG